MSRIKTLLGAALLVVAAPAAHAFDAMSVEYGDSNSTNADVQMYRVGLQWNWGKQWLPIGNWHLGGYWDATLGYWDNNSPGKTNESIIDVGITPVFRFQQTTLSTVSPYVEAAIGFHLLSHTSISTQRQFGTAFQFGDHVGFGVRLGDKGRYDLGYRYQHLSNGSIKGPNNGINFHQIRLQYNF